MSRNIDELTEFSHYNLQRIVQKAIMNKYRKFIEFLTVDMHGGDDYYTENNEWYILVETKKGTNKLTKSSIEHDIEKFINTPKFRMPFGSIVIVK
jgi:hypothetical protein